MSAEHVVDPACVPDVFVSGLHDVEHVGDGIYRFVFYVNQKSIFDGSGEKVVVARLVLSSSAVFFAASWALKAIGARCVNSLVH